MIEESDYVNVSDGMFINTNNQEFQRYKMAREKAVRERSLAEKVQRLETEVSELKRIIKDFQEKIGTD